MPEHIGDKSWGDGERQIETVAHVALALGLARYVDGVDEGVDAGGADAADQVIAGGRVAWRVELVPDIAIAGSRRLGDRAGAAAGKDEGNVRRSGGPRQHQIGIGTQQPGKAGGSDAERGIEAAAEERGCKIDPLDILEIARQQAVARELGLVAGKSALVLGAAFHPIEQDARQPAAGELPQIGNVDRPLGARMRHGQTRGLCL
jgi:hypothetical protein